MSRGILPTVPALPEYLTIGALAARSGLAPSALRFYESRGLLQSERTSGDRRRYLRDALRRVAFIRAAQRVGLSLDEIAAALASLPGGKTPTRADWARLSRSWQPLLDARIAEITKLRDDLTGCIGCGCLSLGRCRLYNPEDTAAAKGPGARYLLGDRAPTPAKALRRRAGRAGR